MRTKRFRRWVAMLSMAAGVGVATLAAAETWASTQEITWQMSVPQMVSSQGNQA